MVTNFQFTQTNIRNMKLWYTTTISEIEAYLNIKKEGQHKILRIPFNFRKLLKLTTASNRHINVF